MSFQNPLDCYWDNPWFYPPLYYLPPPPSYFTKMVSEFHPRSSPCFKKKGHAKRKVEEKVASVKKLFLREHNNGDVDEEVTTGSDVLSSQAVPETLSPPSICFVIGGFIAFSPEQNEEGVSGCFRASDQPILPYPVDMTHRAPIFLKGKCSNSISSTTRLEWKPAQDYFIFGSFGLPFPSNPNSANAMVVAPMTVVTVPLPKIVDIALITLSIEDEEIVKSEVFGSIPSYSLESRLGDCQMAVVIRREAVQRITARSLEGLPLEGFDYESILGQCCELLIRFVQISVGVIGLLLLDGKEYTVSMATTEGCLLALLAES